jgi:hypothetical protein
MSLSDLFMSSMLSLYDFYSKIPEMERSIMNKAIKTSNKPAPKKT